MESHCHFNLHVLSPVHIGCDDVYEPTGFVVDEQAGSLTVFDAMTFIRTLAPQQRDRFVSICMQGTVSSLLTLYQFMSQQKVSGRTVQVSSDFLEHYRQVRKLPVGDERRIKQELNRFAISRTSYALYQGTPYVPGSSLKGAMRTAYLNILAGKTGVSDPGGNAKALETKLLGGSFDTDPFRLVKVSDAMPVGEVGGKIRYAVNKKKKESKYQAKGPYQLLEVVDQGSTFEGGLTVLPSEQVRGIPNPVTMSDLLMGLHKFYAEVLSHEEEVLRDIGLTGSVLNQAQNRFGAELGKSAFLVRIGRHSGAEAVTIKGSRNIKIMQAKGERPQFLDHATTLWLASEARNPSNNGGLTPFGWAVLEVEPLDAQKGIYTQTRDASDFSTDQQIEKTSPVETPEKGFESMPPAQTECKDVHLVWNPGNRSLSTTVEGKKAFILHIEDSFVPERFRAKLFKKKSLVASILVEPLGNAFTIVKILDET